MPTIIKTKTMMCPTGIGNPNADCRFHARIDNLPAEKMCPECEDIFAFATALDVCPECNKALVGPVCKDCKEVLVLATHPEDQCTTTIRDETDFDDPELIDHDGRFMTRAQADEDDAVALKGYLKRVNREAVIDAMAEGKMHTPITEKDDHGFNTPVRKELSQADRDFWKAKVRADIIRFKAIEHK